MSGPGLVRRVLDRKGGMKTQELIDWVEKWASSLAADLQETATLRELVEKQRFAREAGLRAQIQERARERLRELGVKISGFKRERQLDERVAD